MSYDFGGGRPDSSAVKPPFISIEHATQVVTLCGSDGTQFRFDYGVLPLMADLVLRMLKAADDGALDDAPANIHETLDRIDRLRRSS